MSARCHNYEPKFDGASTAYKRVLWTVIALNATMFLVEMNAGLAAGSMALQADALDFLGDTVTYAISFYVIGKSLRWRASAALVKGLSLGAFGLWVLGSTVYNVFILGTPEAATMGFVASLALAVNVLSALLLFRFRDGDANVRSVWLCSRNDAIGNVAVILAAGGVFATNTGWPDLIVAAIMATLFLRGAVQIVRHARQELDHAKLEQAASPAGIPGRYGT